jgi:Glycosyl transferases group 1
LTQYCGDAASILSEETKEVDDLTAEWQELAARLAALQRRHEQTSQKLQESTSALNQIQNSQGWKLLSVCYRLRDKLIPERTARIIREGFALLRDMRLVSTSGQFDKNWYMQRNRDVAQARVPALRHYLRLGAWEGRDPNPFFDSDWYLQQNPDVAESGANPLVHYLRRGAAEGRAPSPLFDSNSYAKQYRTVARSKVNAVAHSAGKLGAEGSNPNLQVPPSRAASHSVPPKRDHVLPAFSADGGQRPKLKIHRIASPAQPKPSTNADKRRLLCMTHVLPYPPRAGNEYRIHRMLDWFAGSGYEVFLVVCPLVGGSISSERLTQACSVYSNLILCERDGTVWYQLAGGDGALKGLDGVRPRQLAELLREEDRSAAILQRLLPVIRTFCPDVMGEVILHLDAVLEPEIILSEYVFMTRVLPLARKAALRVVDTHDVLSTKHDKTVQFGIENDLVLDSKEEATLLSRADLVIAIQPEEAAELRRLVPDKRVITVGVDFDLIKTASAPISNPVVLTVGSDNALNVKGLRDFLRFAWPLVRRDVPDAELRVAGAVGLQVDADDPSVKVLGLVDDLFGAYAEARVVVNPTIAGTGLKIKTIEALCHLRPLVTWPSGVDGVDADVQSLCYVATDWYMFAQHVIHLCQSESASQTLISKRDDIVHRFSPDTTYSALKAALNGMLVGAG